MRDVILVLEMQGWQTIVDQENIPDQSGSSTRIDAVERLGERFRVPLKNTGAQVEQLCEEFREMVLHATQFYSLYQAVWWRLSMYIPNAEEWFNCLTLVRLLTLPVSNDKLERVFSTLKVLKVDKRLLIGNDPLDNCLFLHRSYLNRSI